MGVTCEISIKRPREGFHRAGRSVSGVVRYAIDEPTEYKDIHLCLVGKGLCYWTETRPTTKGREPITYTGTQVYTSQGIRIHNKGSATTFIHAPGTYEYPFRFILPKKIPPSFENDMCTIKYKITVKFENPQYFSVHKKFNAEITVYSYVEAISFQRNAVFGIEKILFKPFTKRTHQVKLKAEICSTMFTPGQNAQLTYTVTNNTDVIIPSVRTELMCYTTYTANCGRKKQCNVQELTIETPSIPGNAVANLTNTLPILSHLLSIQNCGIMVKEYKVKVTVRLPLPHINAFTEMPIVIGERYNDNHVERSVQEIVEEPPSYYEATNENKSKEVNQPNEK